VLKNPKGYPPRCLTINEIGGVCFTGNKKERKRAEEILRNLLKDKNEEHRDIVFCWLCVIDNPDPQTITTIEDFKKDPTNKEIIEKTKSSIEHFNHLHKKTAKEAE